MLVALKKRLKEAKGKWVNELLGVLWAYRTILRRPIGTTLFALTYGMEAVIPTEIGMPTAKMVVQDQMNENQELEIHLDWADKVRRNATIRMTSYQQKAIAHYNKKARPRIFKI